MEQNKSIWVKWNFFTGNIILIGNTISVYLCLYIYIYEIVIDKDEDK